MQARPCPEVPFDRFKPALMPVAPTMTVWLLPVLTERSWGRMAQHGQRCRQREVHRRRRSRQGMVVPDVEREGLGLRSDRAGIQGCGVGLTGAGRDQGPAGRTANACRERIDIQGCQPALALVAVRQVQCRDDARGADYDRRLLPLDGKAWGGMAETGQCRTSHRFVAA